MTSKLFTAACLFPLLFSAACDDLSRFTRPDAFGARPRCTHCEDGPRQEFRTSTKAQPRRARIDLDLAASPEDDEPCPPFEIDEFRVH